MNQGTAAGRQAAVPTIMNSGVSHLTDFSSIVTLVMSGHTSQVLLNLLGHTMKRLKKYFGLPPRCVSVVFTGFTV